MCLLYGCDVIGNTALGEHGGGIFVKQGDITTGPSAVRETGSATPSKATLIQSNTAHKAGGGIYNEQGDINLNGDLASTIHNHTLRIDADRFTPVNDNLIPLGRHMPVDKTPFDFRTAKTIGQDIEAENGQLLTGNGYDHNFVLNRPCLDTPAAELASPVTCIAMQVYTTAPGLQLYTGNFLNGVAGKGGVRYPARSAVCLETQQYPDSPNHRWPESTGYLRPDQPFDSTTIFKFSQQ